MALHDKCPLQSIGEEAIMTTTNTFNEVKLFEIVASEHHNPTWPTLCTEKINHHRLTVSFT